MREKRRFSVRATQSAFAKPLRQTKQGRRIQSPASLAERVDAGRVLRNDALENEAYLPQPKR